MYGRRGVFLAVRYGYRIVAIDNDRSYVINAANYAYEILAEQGDEVLAYHWHPEDPFQPDGRSRMRAPHLHLSNTVHPIALGRDYAPVALADMHLRTGPVLIEDIVELLITEFDVHPLIPTWQTVVDENRRQVWAEWPRW